MKHIVKVHGPTHRIDSGFTTSGDPVVKAPPATPRLSIDDPLKPRLKKTDSDNDEAEARYKKQRELIQSYKKSNPGVSTNQMFADLGQQYPDVFSDPDDEDEMEQDAKATKAVTEAQRAVIAQFRAARPDLSVDEAFRLLAPILVED